MHKLQAGKLKQASRAWSLLLSAFMKTLGFRSSHGDPSSFVYHTDCCLSLVIFYVGDIFLSGNDFKRIDEVIYKFRNWFKVPIIHNVSNVLGFVIDSDEKRVKLHHYGIISRIIKVFRMTNCNPVSLPLVPGEKCILTYSKEVLNDPTPFRQLVSFLLHLKNTTHPDISYAVGYFSRHMHAPTE